MFETFGNWVAFSLFSLNPDSHLGSAVQFFAMDLSKIFILLILIVYILGYVRQYLDGNRIKKYLSGKKKETGRLLAILLGSVSPFCSCSSVPLFIGFIETRIPLGIAFAFLISSPLINEVAIILLISTLGLKITLLYVGLGVSIAYIASFIIEKFSPEQWIEPYVWEISLDDNEKNRSMTFKERHAYSLNEVIKIIKKIWIWLIIGIAIGASFHGFIPTQWITTINEQYSILSVPLAVLIGIPLYSDIAATIPFAEAMLLKGVTLGTVLALIMSISAISLPEFLILRKVIKWKGLALFAGILGISFTFLGWFLNFIYIA
ncbi:MAG TPA: permease [Gammaproteobacteria bacterium]|nr:permease [Gammaproteobacteria bacterium]